MEKLLDKLLEQHWFVVWTVLFALPLLALGVLLSIQYTFAFALIMFMSYCGVVFWDCYLRYGEYRLNFKQFFENISAHGQAIIQARKNNDRNE